MTDLWLYAQNALSFVQEHKIAIASICAGLCAGCVAYKVRKYMHGKRCTCSGTLEGMTALITGANSGIGKEIARDFAKRGARVILACRDITKGERAAEDIRQTTGNRDVRVEIVDLASLESVRIFCRQVLQKENRLDILVDNAGLMGCPNWRSRQGFELHFAINHLGHFLLTNLLIDLLRQSAPSTIIVIACQCYKEGVINFDDINLTRIYDPWTAYTQSQRARILFVMELSIRLADSQVMVNAVDPGATRTQLNRYQNMMGIPWWRRIILSLMSRFLLKGSFFGAQLPICVAISPNHCLTTGAYIWGDVEKETTEDLSKVHADEVEAALQLWDVSAKMVNLPPELQLDRPEPTNEPAGPSNSWTQHAQSY